MNNWRDGNSVKLLENGEEFFPRVVEAVGAARHDIYIETFILREDKVGIELCAALCAAARRGVNVEVVVDGFGSEEISESFLQRTRAAGVDIYRYEPLRRLLGFRTNLYRRMHRKIILIDGCLAFIGGINFCLEHLREFGPKGLHDYAVELRGPVVADMVAFVRRWSRQVRLPLRGPVTRELPPDANAHAGTARVLFVTRDNRRHPTSIERHYRAAFRLAQNEVVIANAYFFPGYRVLRDLRNAARRGVRVVVIVQGNPDMQIVTVAARWLYHYLVPAGVEVQEFHERPLHAKVAVADDRWSTVGSSNLDPLSLSLNLEANVVIEDAAFRDELRQRLQRLLDHSCRPVTPAQVPRRTWWRVLGSSLLFHFLRHFPRWAGWLPAHRPQIVALPDAGKEEGAG